MEDTAANERRLRHAECCAYYKAKREEFMKNSVPKRPRILEYTPSEMKKNPIQILKEIEKLFCDSLSVEEQTVTVKNVDNYVNAVDLLGSFALIMGRFHIE